MSNDAIIRTIAVCVAAGLLAAPYWRVVADAVAKAAQAAKANAKLAGRIAAAGLIVAAAWGVVPMPKLPAPVPAVVVPTPSPEMQALVGPVRTALSVVPAASRAVWAATWSKAALVVEADSGTATQAFADTQALRTFTGLALDIAWRRIYGHAPGSVPGLRDSVENALKAALGLDAVPVTQDVRARYAEIARAIAWAATGG